MKLLFVLAILTSLNLWAAEEKGMTSFSFRAGAAKYTLSGSVYKSKEVTAPSLNMDLSYGFPNNWRLFLNVQSDSQGQLMGVGIGGAYHFGRYIPQIEHVSESATINRIYKWSPYVGAELSVFRSQVSLNRSDSSVNSDVVLAALYGATLHAGAYYSMGRSWSLNADVFSAFGNSAQLSLANYGLTLGFLIFLP
ncbi:MAG: hypothetical protein H6623_00240 [Bdellovibrionaceae bacterium]|nr:hypothetical protein [Pseudobdellovibrionaceae bacterium]